jgi:hypothetical protein
VQALVLQGQSGGGADRLHELLVVLQRGVVQQHRDRLSVVPAAMPLKTDEPIANCAAIAIITALPAMSTE